MTRICITGGPRTGKTTLGLKLAYEMAEQEPRVITVIRHTDSLIHLGWSAASADVCAWLDDPGPWIIEGVAVSRALRKWHDQHPSEPPPVDRVIYLSEPHETLAPGQLTMAKGVRTVHDEIETWLREHGIDAECSST